MKTSCSFVHINKQTAQSYSMDTEYLGVVVLSDYEYATTITYVPIVAQDLNDQYHT